MQPINKQSGFTLFETLIYIALFSLLLTGTFWGAFQVIESQRGAKARSLREAEAHFIYRKIDWALNGDVISVSTPGENRLEVDKVGGDEYDFWIENEVMVLNDVDTPLSSDAIKITDFTARYTAGPPALVEISFVVDDLQFSTSSRYLRGI